MTSLDHYFYRFDVEALPIAISMCDQIDALKV